MEESVRVQFITLTPHALSTISIRLQFNVNFVVAKACPLIRISMQLVNHEPVLAITAICLIPNKSICMQNFAS